MTAQLLAAAQGGRTEPTNKGTGKVRIRSRLSITGARRSCKITQFHLPPDRGDVITVAHAEVAIRFIDSGRGERLSWPDT